MNKGILEKKDVIVDHNLGIDLLKIVSMIMVVTLHVLSQGGLLFSISKLSVKYEILWFIECMAYCAVNCYALISGYVGINSKFKYSRIWILWCQVLFYNTIITIIYSIFVPGSISVKNVMMAFFPTLSNQYWYFTAYFCMFFFIPVLNHIVNTMTKVYLIKTLCVMGIFFSVIPTIIHKDIFGTHNGYSVLWIMIMYILGAYIKKYNVMKKIKKSILLMTYIISVLLTWGTKLCIEIVTYTFLGMPRDGGVLIAYTSPTIIIAGIALLGFFSKLNVERMKSGISFFAPLSFSVYIIHTNPVIADIIIKNRMVSYIDLSIVGMILCTFITIFVIFITCAFVDEIRSLLFKLFHIKNKVENIGDKITKILNKIMEYFCR